MQLLEEWGKHKITVKRMSFKIPMQNKILSLKEIDQLDAYYEIRCSDEGDFEISRYNMKSLIATARAYHEKLKEEAMESVSRCCGATMGRSFSGGLICDHCC